jgi:hypothetical protein
VPELVVAVEAVAVEVLADKSNGSFVSLLEPVGFADDDFDDVSAWRASRADDAAPRANNMAELRQRRLARPVTHASSSANAMPLRKTQ